MKHGLIIAAILVATGCGGGSVKIHKPTDEATNRNVTAMWERDIKKTARSGDWILTRSYSLTGDIITTVAPGEDVSHASIYDARTGTIIEARRPTVQEVPLENLLARNDLVIVIRPHSPRGAQGTAAVDRARATVGTEFDLQGMLGLGDNDQKFYCSELVYWASAMDPVNRPRIITPASLMEYGEVVYYGGRRTDKQVQEAARWSTARKDATDVSAR
jgi:uncharacterized protein YycO